MLFGADREAIVEPGLGVVRRLVQRVYFHQQLFAAEVLSRKSFQNPLEFWKKILSPDLSNLPGTKHGVVFQH
jgi:hypothetical protein